MRLGTGIGAALVVLVCAVPLTACTGGAENPGPDPLSLAWQEISLPSAPSGTRTVLAGAAGCEQRWYLVGGYDRTGSAPDEEWLGTDDTMDPAAWSSLDGENFRALPVAAHSYYGIRSLLWSAACRGDSVVALGGKVGGAHGNPRMASYFPVTAADGTTALAEVDASFELYGGPKATNVGRLTAGPPGYLIVGNRSAGAAVWISPTGERFEIVEGAPGLASTPEVGTWAADAAFHDGEWVVVGARTDRTGRDPAAWRSPDGRAWTAMQADSAADYDELSAVAAVGESLMAVGNHGETFQAWRLEADGWRAAGRFGSTRVEPSDGQLTSAIPVDLTAAGDRLFALVKAGWAYQVWTSADGGGSWRPVPSPVDLPATDGGRAALVGMRDRVVLIADDGEQAHAFIASTSEIA